MSSRTRKRNIDFTKEVENAGNDLEEDDEDDEEYEDPTVEAS
jgi:hypothetical protein